MQPSCVLFSATKLESAWLVFHSKHEQAQPQPLLNPQQQAASSSLPRSSGNNNNNNPNTNNTAAATEAPSLSTATPSTTPSSSKTFVRDVCAVSPFALLLFGGDVTVHAEEATVVVDECIRLAAPARVGVLVKQLRNELQRLLHDKLKRPELELSGSPILDAIVQLLTTDASDA
eukprot:6212064-Pleurochrysis_carterae.AAC.1